jgi:hypothetical protein
MCIRFDKCWPSNVSCGLSKAGWNACVLRLFAINLPLQKYGYLISVLSIVPQWNNKRLSLFVLIGNRISN